MKQLNCSVKEGGGGEGGGTWANNANNNSLVGVGVLLKTLYN